MIVVKWTKSSTATVVLLTVCLSNQAVSPDLNLKFSFSLEN